MRTQASSATQRIPLHVILQDTVGGKGYRCCSLQCCRFSPRFSPYIDHREHIYIVQSLVGNRWHSGHVRASRENELIRDSAEGAAARGAVFFSCWGSPYNVQHCSFVWHVRALCGHHGTSLCSVSWGGRRRGCSPLWDCLLMVGTTSVRQTCYSAHQGVWTQLRSLIVDLFQTLP